MTKRCNTTNTVKRHKKKQKWLKDVTRQKPQKDVTRQLRRDKMLRDVTK